MGETSDHPQIFSLSSFVTATHEFMQMVQYTGKIKD